MTIAAPARQLAALRDGAGALGADLASLQLERLFAYVALLAKWGRIYNLTAATDHDEIVKWHLLDCLSVVAPLRRETGNDRFSLLDIGSGAGLPGAVIAIALPEARVTCVDATAKKVGFLHQVAADLQLPNLRSIHSRVEDLAPAPHDIVAARAFASLADLVALSERHVAPRGLWLAMKGRISGRELAELPRSIDAFHVEPVSVPGLHERHLVWMRRRQPSLPA